MGCITQLVAHSVWSILMPHDVDFIRMKITKYIIDTVPVEDLKFYNNINEDFNPTNQNIYLLYLQHVTYYY